MQHRYKTRCKQRKMYKTSHHQLSYQLSASTLHLVHFKKSHLHIRNLSLLYNYV